MIGIIKYYLFSIKTREEQFMRNIVHNIIITSFLTSNKNIIITKKHFSNVFEKNIGSKDHKYLENYIVFRILYFIFKCEHFKYAYGS